MSVVQFDTKIKVTYDDLNRLPLQDLYSHMKSFNLIESASKFYMSIYVYVAQQREIWAEKGIGSKKEGYNSLTDWAINELGLTKFKLHYYKNLGTRLFELGLLKDFNKPVLDRLVQLGVCKSSLLLNSLDSLDEIRRWFEYAEAVSHEQLKNALLDYEQGGAQIEMVQEGNEMVAVERVEKIAHSGGTIIESKSEVNVRLYSSDYTIFQRALSAIRTNTKVQDNGKLLSMLASHYLATYQQGEGSQKDLLNLKSVILGLEKLYGVKIKVEDIEG